jgi:hypothetical protein
MLSTTAPSSSSTTEGSRARPQQHYMIREDDIAGAEEATSTTRRADEEGSRCAICMDVICTETHFVNENENDEDDEDDDEDDEQVSRRTNDAVITMACGHRIHAGCFFRYASHHQQRNQEDLRCPLCRNVVMRQTDTASSARTSAAEHHHQFVMTMEIEPSSLSSAFDQAAAAMAEAIPHSLLSTATGGILPATIHIPPSTSTTASTLPQIQRPNTTFPFINNLLFPRGSSATSSSSSSSSSSREIVISMTTITTNVCSVLSVGVCISSLYCVLKTMQFMYYILAFVSELDRRA